LDAWAISKWRDETLPISLTAEDKAILDAGVISIFGRDKFYRPILLLRPTIQLDFVITPESMVRATTYLVLYAKDKFFIPGKVETWVMVADLNFYMPWQLPIKQLRPMSDTLSLMFRCHAAKVIVLNASQGFVWAFGGISKFL
jgi:hypothetical protein